MPKAGRSAPRRRMKAEEARAAILDAAERQLAARGPDGLRLQEVAAEVGLSHPTVLHHFGSRDALVVAVVERALYSAQVDIVSAIATTPPRTSEDDASYIEGLMQRMAAVLDERGHGRTIAWLALAGVAPSRDDVGMRVAAEATHAVRTARRKGTTPSLLDTQFTLLLSYYALFAQSVVGSLVLRSAGLKDDAKTRAQFRRWLARLVSLHLQTGTD